MFTDNIIELLDYNDTVAIVRRGLTKVSIMSVRNRHILYDLAANFYVRAHISPDNLHVVLRPLYNLTNHKSTIVFNIATGKKLGEFSHKLSNSGVLTYVNSKCEIKSRYMNFEDLHFLDESEDEEYILLKSRDSYFILDRLDQMIDLESKVNLLDLDRELLDLDCEVLDVTILPDRKLKIIAETSNRKSIFKVSF